MTRLLAIDAGNTRIKWGVFDSVKWNPCGALPTAEAARAGEKWNLVEGHVAAIASNVAGPEVQRQLQLACEARGWPLAVIASQPAQLGVTNGYRDHRQLGADRWAGLIAAHHGHRGHKLVVNAGTALTIDALNDDGRFEGGLVQHPRTHRGDPVADRRVGRHDLGRDVGDAAGELGLVDQDRVLRHRHQFPVSGPIAPYSTLPRRA